jgi:hypothetical protein
MDVCNLLVTPKYAKRVVIEDNDLGSDVFKRVMIEGNDLGSDGFTHAVKRSVDTATVNMPASLEDDAWVRSNETTIGASINECSGSGISKLSAVSPSSSSIARTVRVRRR